ncbi:MAG: shikimate dehydrogenase [Armatimonadetes bacterium]|nr:shikimate dehydrogenase [Armatimonadota bacterium]
MNKFAFIIHPVDAKRDAARKFPIARYLPERVVEWGLKKMSPKMISHITGVRSVTGTEAEGWFVACPLTPRQLLSLPLEFVYEKIIAAGRVAESLGAGVLGLGAFTSVVGDGGITIARHLDIGVTSGNSFTVATAIEGAVEGARQMDIDPARAQVAVVGATGSIGATCAEILSRQAPVVTLVGRNAERLEEAAKRFRAGAAGRVEVSTDIKKGIQDADIIITVTSAVDAVIEPGHLKSGAVVCDVARPRDVSRRVVEERDDVLVIEGGVVAVPGPVDFGFNFGFPPGMAYACMSETMLLALEGRYEDYTLGKEVTVAQVEETQRLARKHGFKLTGFRSFEKAVPPEAIEAIRSRIKRRATA